MNLAERLIVFMENEARSCSMALAVLHLNMFIVCGMELSHLRISKLD